MLKTVNFTEYITKPSVVKDGSVAGLKGRMETTNLCFIFPLSAWCPFSAVFSSLFGWTAKTLSKQLCRYPAPPLQKKGAIWVRWFLPNWFDQWFHLSRAMEWRETIERLGFKTQRNHASFCWLSESDKKTKQTHLRAVKQYAVCSFIK